MYSWSFVGFLSSINMTFSSGSQQGVCVHVIRVQSLTQHFPGPALFFLHVSVSHTPCEMAPGGCSSPYPCHRSSSLDRRVLCGKTFLSHTPRGGPRKSSQVRSPPRSGREHLSFTQCSVHLPCLPSTFHAEVYRIISPNEWTNVLFSAYWCGQ